MAWNCSWPAVSQSMSLTSTSNPLTNLHTCHWNLCSLKWSRSIEKASFSAKQHYPSQVQAVTRNLIDAVWPDQSFLQTKTFPIYLRWWWKLVTLIYIHLVSAGFKWRCPSLCLEFWIQHLDDVHGLNLLNLLEEIHANRLLVLWTVDASAKLTDHARLSDAAISNNNDFHLSCVKAHIGKYRWREICGSPRIWKVLLSWLCTGVQLFILHTILKNLYNP